MKNNMKDKIVLKGIDVIDYLNNYLSNSEQLNKNDNYTSIDLELAKSYVDVHIDMLNHSFSHLWGYDDTLTKRKKRIEKLYEE